MPADQVAQVRRFNRLVTQRIGALDDHFLGRDRPLGASRLLYEIGPQGADLRDLRRHLGLDAGYVSRLAKALAREGLVRLGPGSGDQRVRKARLTAWARREIGEMTARRDGAAPALPAPPPPKRGGALVAERGGVHPLLRAAGLQIGGAVPASPAAGWCAPQFFAELDRR